MITPQRAWRRLVGWLATLVVLTAALVVGAAVSASASWSTAGTGAGTVAVGVLDAPTGVTVSSYGATVTIGWTAPTPPEGTLSGYTVTRFLGSTPSPACGTDPADVGSFIPDGTLTCDDAGVADGTYTYTVTAVFRTWTEQSAPSGPVDVWVPSQIVSLAPAASNAAMVGSTVYYRPSVGGSFALVDTVTSTLSDPASATFADVGALGWTHPAETVSVGAGGPPTVAYTSSGYTWTASPDPPPSQTVTGVDTRGVTVQSTLSFVPDSAGPLGGALVVNGTSADGPGTSSYARTTFSIGRTDYNADVSTVASSVLTVESASLSGNVCGAYGAPVELLGSPSQSGLSTGCYRYSLTGTDGVGNTSAVTTVVVYDAGVPSQTVTLTDAVNASQTGNIIYFRSAAGSFVLHSSLTDTETLPESVTFPTIATSGWTHPAETASAGTGLAPTFDYASSAYSFTGAAGTPGSHSVVGRDLAGNTVTTALTFSKDNTAPAGGQLTVNGGVASGGGSTSFSSTGAYAISLRTDYTDAASGLDSSDLTESFATLSGNVCGTYGAATLITGNPAQSGKATGCWKYVLTGTDNVGNTVSITTTVKVDLDDPTSGALTVNGQAADTGGTTVSYAKAAFPIDSRTDWVDAESGLATSTLTRASATLSGNACGTFGTTTTIVGTPSQTGLATNCYRYVLTGTDNAGNAVSVSTIVKYDTAAPTGGALTVNAVAATAPGTSSYNSDWRLFDQRAHRLHRHRLRTGLERSDGVVRDVDRERLWNLRGWRR